MFDINLCVLCVAHENSSTLLVDQVRWYILFGEGALKVNWRGCGKGGVVREEPVTVEAGKLKCAPKLSCHKSI